MKRSSIVAFVLACILTGVISHFSDAQTVQTGLTQDKVGKLIVPLPEVPVVYTPIDLGMNGVSFGSGGSTTQTKLVSLAGVHALTLFVNCTQTMTVNFNAYDETQTLFATYGFVTGLTSGANQVYVSTELAPNATIGTVAINLRMPQVYGAFSFTNTNASAGTCTARLMVRY